MTQGARTRVLEDFKDGYVNALVATDVAARGIHVDGIDLVLNVDPAGDHKDYLHRSGRTARAGKSGVGRLAVAAAPAPPDLPADGGRGRRRLAPHHPGRAASSTPEVAEITGARSLTEVQADSASNAASRPSVRSPTSPSELERAAAPRHRAARGGRPPHRACRPRAWRGPREASPPPSPPLPRRPPRRRPAQAAAPAERQERPSRTQRPQRRDDRGNYERVTVATTVRRRLRP